MQKVKAFTEDLKDEKNIKKDKEIEGEMETHMPTHKKLIRNKIPQIIKNNGKTPTTRILAEHEGTTLEEINNIRKKKAEERGGFSDRVFLIEVTNN